MTKVIKVTYKGGNGHLNPQPQEKELIVGKKYEVIGGFMYSSSSGYELKDFPGVKFNTVLFEKNQEAWDYLVDKDWPAWRKKQNPEK